MPALSVPQVRFALRADDETNSVRVSSPRTLRGLGTDRCLRTATGRTGVDSAFAVLAMFAIRFLVGAIVSCDARYQGRIASGFPVAPSAVAISTLTTALLGWSQNQKGSV